MQSNNPQKRIQDLQRQLDAANNVAKTLSQQAAATQEVRKRTLYRRFTIADPQL